MKTATLIGVMFATACLAGACGKGREAQTSAARESSDRPQAGGTVSQPARPPGGSTTASPGPTPAPKAATSARDVCALLPAAEVAEITGIPVERVEKATDGCAWFGNAAAQREKGAASARGAFETMSKQEPASFDDAMRNMEGIVKGFTGAVGAGGPLFSASVQSENADQAEAILKGTYAMIGAGTPGGKLELVEGLGDRAYVGPVGSFLYVRKGPVLLSFDLRTFPGTREQAITLARRLVSRL